MPEAKHKTIADQFHEALSAASTNEAEHMYAVPRNKWYVFCNIVDVQLFDGVFVEHLIFFLCYPCLMLVIS